MECEIGGKRTRKGERGARKEERGGEKKRQGIGLTGQASHREK